MVDHIETIEQSLNSNPPSGKFIFIFLVIVNIPDGGEYYLL